MSFLIRLRTSLSSAVDYCHLRRPASVVYQNILRLLYGDSRTIKSRQNDRVWRLHYQVALRGEYQEFETVEWLRSVIKPGDFVIDVGANVGQMTLEMAELVGETGRVIAIEPAPGNLKILKLHVESNGFSDRVEIIPAACGANHGQSIVLRVYGESKENVGSGHTIRSYGLDEGCPVSETTVPLVSIDGVCQERNIRPAVMKIDVEGAEIEVIAGAVETLRTIKPFVQVGFHPFAFEDAVTASATLCELLDDCGYLVPELKEGQALDLAEYQLSPGVKPNAT